METIIYEADECTICAKKDGELIWHAHIYPNEGGLDENVIAQQVVSDLRTALAKQAEAAPASDATLLDELVEVARGYGNSELLRASLAEVLAQHIADLRPAMLINDRHIGAPAAEFHAQASQALAQRAASVEAQPVADDTPTAEKAGGLSELLEEVSDVLSGNNWRGDLVEALRDAAQQHRQPAADAGGLSDTFGDWLNEPNSTDESPAVRDYRYEAYRRWRDAVGAHRRPAVMAGGHAAAKQVADRADQPGFETWAKHHGGLPLDLADHAGMTDDKTMAFPTYRASRTEIAWRAWANRQPAMGAGNLSAQVREAFKELVSKNTHRRPRITGNYVEYHHEIDTFQIGRDAIDIAYGKAARPTASAAGLKGGA